MRVLVIEDEQRLAQNVARILKENASSAVDMAFDGEEGLFLAESNPYDLIVLDLMLPKVNGLELLRKYRKNGAKTPVLVVTAKDEKESVIALLNAGADDYITKPFDLGEFVARAKALIRRGLGEHSTVIQIDDLELNSTARRVFRGGEPIALTPMEYRVLEYLAYKRGAIVSKTELLEHLYDYNWEKFSNVIEVYIAALRRKIDGMSEAKLIHTLRGQGYSLHAEGTVRAKVRR